ncbi:MAG: DUF5654 family protein [archaeon]
MGKVTIGGIVQTSIVTAFTIAAALIWKDIFTEFVEIFFPQDILFYKFIAAIIATVFVILAIYVTLRTEQGAEEIVRTIKNMNKEKRKKILREIKKEKAKEELRKVK